MAKFRKTQITNKGQALMTKSLLGSNLRFTKIVVSDTIYLEDSLQELTEIAPIKQQAAVENIQIVDDTSAKISGILSNAGLAEGYYIQTIGLYADDPDEGEILYSVTTAENADWMPPADGISSSSMIINLLTAVQRMDRLEINENPAAYASQADVVLINRKLADLSGFVGYLDTDPDILGVEVDFANNRFTRLAGAVGLEAGEDFNQFPMYNRRRCNLTDDGCVTAYWGDEAYTETGFTEQQITIDDPYSGEMAIVIMAGTPVQVMVEQKPFYYKVVPLELEPAKNGQWAITKARYYISDKPKAGFTLHPAFDRSGRYNIYLAAFEGSRYIGATGEYERGMIDPDDEIIIDSGGDPERIVDKLSSVANAKVLEASRNGMFDEMGLQPRFEALVRNREGADGGMGLGEEKWRLHREEHISITQLLFLIEYASFNAREHIGKGLVHDTSHMGGVADTGYTSPLGNASGTAAGFEGTAVSYRGEENLWGNTTQYISVSVGDDGEVRLGNMGSRMGIRTPSYEGYLPVPTPNEGGYGATINYGWVSRFLYADYLFIPAKLDGDSNLPVSDFYMMETPYNPNKAVLCFGGWREQPDFGLTDMYGLFSYWGYGLGFSFGGARVSARLVYVDSPTQEMLR